MMNSVDILFHPVGQGLFASGHLSDSGGQARFSWVYDCGSLSRGSKQRLDRAMDVLADALGGSGRRIDLLVLSHFDNDHVNGVARLLTRFEVGTLLLPLVPLWQRLEVLFSQGRYVSRAMQRFHLDPLRAVAALPNQGIDRIIAVPPSTSDGPGSDADDQVPLSPSPRDERQDGPRLFTSRRLESVRMEGDEQEPPGTPPIFELPPGGRLTLPGVWEFVPFNGARRPQSRDRGFIERADLLRRALLDQSTESTRRDSLSALKRHYESVHRTPKHRNEISLFLYAGATQQPRRSPARCRQCGGTEVRNPVDPVAYEWPCARLHDGPGILYTGDAYLNKSEKWLRLSDYLGQERASSLLAFQVMHHGAAGNWHDGLARSVAARFALMPADPTHGRYKHPSDRVLSDFCRASQVSIINEKGFHITSEWP